ncbi:General transcription factor II-I repeat domain-containing protein 2A [Eumeta japonica]|uniref:General transcription factor II-I repeat domain-containing protein 2A n=1 Tax=Eumeta variegata TaxID=151549 RepID=A0A4C1UJQ2_EUMVA|nr:General transcription factor II-I repeat domain-containing protein 2A [Eumeta japonica]
MAGFESFFTSLDESTDLSDIAQLAIFIRGVDKEFTVTEELLALQPLKGTTTGENIFNEVQKDATKEKVKVEEVDYKKRWDDDRSQVVGTTCNRIARDTQE